MRDTQPLTMTEFEPADHDAAELVARKFGYSQYVYTSTSALWGLFCLPENPASDPHGPYVQRVIIKTRELGIVVVQTLEDLGLEPDGAGTLRRQGGKGGRR